MANKIVFEIFADNKQFISQMEKVNKTAKMVNRNAGISFLALGASIALVTKLAKDQEKVMNQTRSVIKSTGGVAKITAESVFALGKELQRTTTFGDEAVISATNLLLTFKDIGGDTIPRATRAVLDMSTAMEQGLKESSIQLGKALNDPILGLTAMRRVGIQFTKSQEDQIKSLTKMGKTAQAQGVILTELESQFGGSAESARKGLGSIDALTNSLGDLGEAIGVAIAPEIERLANAFTDVSDSISDNPELTRLIGTMLLLATAIAGVIFVVSGLVVAITTVGAVGALAIAGLVTGIAAVFLGFDLFGNKTDETGEKLKSAFGEENIDPEGAIFTMESIKKKMIELGDEAIILGTALQAGLAAGIVVTADKPSEGGEGETSNPLIDGFKIGLDEIGVKIQDLTALGKELANTLQSGMAKAFSGILTGAKTAKQAFVDFGKAMLTAIVNFIAEWIAFQILSKAASIAASVFQIATAVTTATATASAWAPAAALASLASFGANSVPASAGIVSTLAVANLAAVPKFAVGASNLRDDTLGQFNKSEIVIPEAFSDGLRKGDLSLSGGDSEGAGGGGQQVILNFDGATFVGVTPDLVEEIFTSASEQIDNGTLAFNSGVQV